MTQLTLAELMRRSVLVGGAKDSRAAEALTSTLKDDLDAALAACTALGPLTHRARRDECGIENRGGKPAAHLEVVYDLAFGTHYTTEVTFVLRRNVLSCLVQTWHYAEGNEHWLGLCEIALDGELFHSVQGASFEELAAAAVVQAVEHRIALIARQCGVEVTESTRQALLAQPLDTLRV